MKKPMNKHLITLEALADAAVAVELEEGVPDKESRAAAAKYHALVSDRLGEMRRAELARIAQPSRERRTIRPALLAMARDALVAEYARLKSAHPNLGFAHRKLAEITDDDLRTMLEDIYWMVERVS
ncbi:MAG: hypothetical protein JO257_15150 [Deltaproteobacteria bacterium]|nr:hypothetical protein [Deltaproteobacteria bacterium]